MFVCSLYRSLREKNCTKPDVFLNVLKHYMLSPRLSKSYYLFFIFDCMFIDNLNRKHNIKGAKCAKRTLLYNGCVLFSLSIFNFVHYSISALNISVEWTCAPDPEEFRQLCQIQKKKTYVFGKKWIILSCFRLIIFYTEIIRRQSICILKPHTM